MVAEPTESAHGFWARLNKRYLGAGAKARRRAALNEAY
jgi:hypothetical protein